MKIGKIVIVMCAAVGVSGALDETGLAKDSAMQTLSTDGFGIGIDNTGYIRSMTDASKKSYSPANCTDPILSVVEGGTTYGPKSAVWSGKEIELAYENGVKAKIAVSAKPTHLTFELLSVAPKEKVEMVDLGPLRQHQPIKKAGALTGLLWDDQFGTWPADASITKTVYRAPRSAGEGAGRPTAAITSAPAGVQCLRVHFKASFPGEDVIGSKIALFGCPAG